MIRVTRRVGAAFLCTLAAAVLPLAAAQPLFPKPIHLVREIDDSLSGKVSRVDEYYVGDRAITIRGDHTAIADYGTQELTEIDRAKATYSVAPFARIAAARASSGVKGARSGTAKQTIARTGSDRRAGRNVDLFSADDPQSSIHARMAVDPAVSLSRDAFDVVTGAAFPKSGGPADELLRGAAAHPHVALQGTSSAAGSAQSVQAYGLPLEQQIQWESQGKSIVVTNRVLVVDDRLPPPELTTIPPGASRIESRILEAQRVAADADALVPSRH